VPWRGYKGTYCWCFDGGLWHFVTERSMLISMTLTAG
jgi:hypothetical protein